VVQRILHDIEPKDAINGQLNAHPRACIQVPMYFLLAVIDWKIRVPVEGQINW